MTRFEPTMLAASTGSPGELSTESVSESPLVAMSGSSKTLSRLVDELGVSSLTVTISSGTRTTGVSSTAETFTTKVSSTDEPAESTASTMIVAVPF